MSKIGAYQPEEKYKNYLLPTSKPSKNQTFYQEKVWTVQEHIFLKLKKVTDLLKSLYPKLSDQYVGNVKMVIERNLEKLIEDLELLQNSVDKDPKSFNTKKLQTNQNCITEMKSACDNLQTVRTYEQEFKTLGKIRHALSELEHLIQPTKLEKSLKKSATKKAVKRVATSANTKKKATIVKRAKARTPKKAAKKITKPKAKASVSKKKK